MLIPFFVKRKPPVLLRCANCAYELELSYKEIQRLEKKNAADSFCPIKEECHICHICHIGFMIPVRYTDTKGKIYLFHEIKPKIKSLDPRTVMQRIFAEANSFMFFRPYDKH